MWRPDFSGCNAASTSKEKPLHSLSLYQVIRWGPWSACEQTAEGYNLWHAVRLYVAVMVTVTITWQQICSIHLLLDSASACGSLCDVTWPKWSLHSNVTCSVGLRCWGSASASILSRAECWAIVRTLAWEFCFEKGTWARKGTGSTLKCSLRKLTVRIRARERIVNNFYRGESPNGTVCIHSGIQDE